MCAPIVDCHSPIGDRRHPQPPPSTVTSYGAPIVDFFLRTPPSQLLTPTITTTSLDAQCRFHVHGGRRQICTVTNVVVDNIVGVAGGGASEDRRMEFVAVRTVTGSFNDDELFSGNPRNGRRRREEKDEMTILPLM
ncbi:hypothetical protein E3N88_09513 [Mikania micrantha]|uniref:Uncharacterized protein n=1 Tax=Mikania micrantha TaxID=192012 RepID=A0A5N6PK55_9ASTR|nr:hypothetical protein E3N88_09513 [Mikania micrantha]